MNAAGAHPRLVADVGGTHARIAWIASAGAPLSHVAHHACAEFPALEALLAHYRRAHALPAPRAAALAVAAPVEAGARSFTNGGWSIDPAALAQALGVAPLLCNDFRALARGLPLLSPDATQAIGAGAPIAGAPCAVVGAGTGLGVAGLVFRAERATVVSGEGGHATLAAEDDEEAALVRILVARHGRVSAERVLSGAGLLDLHAAICARAGLTPAATSPAQVVAGDAAGDPTCRLAVERFARWLGAFAGDMALVLGAHGGVYLAGGVVAALGAERLERSSFRARFEAKGRHASRMAAIATRLVADPASCALQGASALLDDAAADDAAAGLAAADLAAADLAAAGGAAAGGAGVSPIGPS